MTTFFRPLPPDDLEHVLTHTADLWPQLRGERLFITGGTGFFGIWLLETLAHANNRLGLDIQATVLSRNPTAFTRKAPHLAGRTEFRWIEGDVRDFAFPQGEHSHVIHAATEASAALNATQPQEMFDVIVSGTRRVLDFAGQAGTENLLLTSSGAVYGRQPPELNRIPETYAGAPDPTDPQSAYGEGKRVAELLCALAHSQSRLKPKIARCFAFVGPHLPLDAHFAVGNFIRDALAGRQIVVQGDGRPFRSYLYAADLAVWLWTILVRGQPNRPYNVGSADALNIRALAELVAARALPASSLGVNVLQAEGREAPHRYVPDIERAQSELSLRVPIPLDQAIDRTFGFYF